VKNIKRVGPALDRIHQIFVMKIEIYSKASSGFHSFQTLPARAGPGLSVFFAGLPSGRRDLTCFDNVLEGFHLPN